MRKEVSKKKHSNSQLANAGIFHKKNLGELTLGLGPKTFGGRAGPQKIYKNENHDCDKSTPFPLFREICLVHSSPTTSMP